MVATRRSVSISLAVSPDAARCAAMNRDQEPVDQRPGAAVGDPGEDGDDDERNPVVAEPGG